MPSLAAGLAAERRRKNAKHARRLEKKLGVKVAGSEERRLSGVFGHSVSVLSTGLSRTFSRRRSSDAFDMSRAEQLAQESRRRLTRRILIFVVVVLVVGGAGFVTVWQAFFVPPPVEIPPPPLPPSTPPPPPAPPRVPLPRGAFYDGFLAEAVKEWLWDEDAALAAHGPIEEWDVSRVRSAAHLFENALHFDGDLSKWDVSSVEDFSHMFSGAFSFTGTRGGSDLSRWDTSAAVDLSYMLRYAVAFNGTVGGWDTRNVADMSHIFAHAGRFNSPLPWRTIRVTSFRSAFYRAASFDQSLATWSTASATDTAYMFREATAFDQPLVRAHDGDGGWFSSGSVRDTAFMFHGASSFRGAGLDTWDVENVNRMSSMFGDGTEAGATGLNAATMERVAALWYDQTPYFPLEYIVWDPTLRPPPPMPALPPWPPRGPPRCEENCGPGNSPDYWDSGSVAPIMIGIVMTIFTLLFFFCFGRWLWRRSRE